MKSLRIRQAADLFEALRSPSIRAREAVLAAIETQPAAALALGRAHDWDVIDELVHQSYQSCSVPYYRRLMRALAGYDDPRVADLFTKVAGMARDGEVLGTVCEYLRTHDLSAWQRSSGTPAEAAGSAESEGGRTESDEPPE